MSDHKMTLTPTITGRMEMHTTTLRSQRTSLILFGLNIDRVVVGFGMEGLRGER
jgi:hypothetical protein